MPADCPSFDFSMKTECEWNHPILRPALDLRETRGRPEGRPFFNRLVLLPAPGRHRFLLCDQREPR